MYVILVNDDNTLTTTKRQRIMQKSKLVDDLYFLVNPLYNGYNMENFTVLLEYTLPVSQELRTEMLDLSAERYKGFLQYVLPVDTELTNESGEIELKLTFLTIDENNTQRVRKVGNEKILISPTKEWSDIIPDTALSALDQRILETDAQIKELREIGEVFEKTKADNLAYNNDTNELQLMSGETPIGDSVEIDTMDDEEIEAVVEEALSGGVPVVEF